MNEKKALLLFWYVQRNGVMVTVIGCVDIGEHFFGGHGMIDINVINDGTRFICGFLD